MNFTDKDKMLARKYREAGYKWIARDARDTLHIFKRKPIRIKFNDNDLCWFDNESKIVDKRNFLLVQFSDSEPTRLDDIIGELI